MLRSTMLRQASLASRAWCTLRPQRILSNSCLTSNAPRSRSTINLPKEVLERRWASTINDAEEYDSSSNSEGKSKGRKNNKKQKRGKPHFRTQQSKPTILSLDECRQLFDKLSAHVPLQLIRHICTLLKKKKKLASSSGSFASKVKELWKHEPDKKKIPPIWVQDSFKQVLMGRSKKLHGIPRKIKNDKWNEDIDLLMKIREYTLEGSLFWSSAHRHNVSKSKEAKEDKVKAVLQKVAESAETQRHAQHLTKSDKQQRQDAEKLLKYLTSNIPADDLLDWLKELRGLCKSVESPTSSLQSDSTLFSQLLNSTPSHAHLVVSEVAEFFYFELSDADLRDKRLSRAEKQYNELRERFASAIPSFQQTVLEGKPATKRQLEEQAVDVEINRKPPAEESQEEGSKKRIKRKPFHVSLDAMLLTTTFPEVPESDKMIFVDNLPIDITEMELKDLYSRCGPIRFLSIFNQRLDLDPGPLTPSALQQRKRSARMSHISSPSYKWDRPKTPVYALISFATDQGFQAAIDSPLRLFGMVVRKHAMRSIRASDRTKLYIENLPGGLHTLDLEYQMARFLKEQDIYVCLDLGQNQRAEPTSCEIAFPSFETAFVCFDKVNESVKDIVTTSEKNSEDEEEALKEATVNWIRTPPDAVKYWTRQIGFD